MTAFLLSLAAVIVWLSGYLAGRVSARREVWRLIVSGRYGPSNRSAQSRLLSAAAAPVMTPLPQWLIFAVGILATVLCIWSYVYDRRRDRPLDWDPQAWRTWLERQDRSVSVRGVAWGRRLRNRVRTLLGLPYRHGSRAVAHPDLAQGVEQLERALERHEGRMIA